MSIARALKERTDKKRSRFFDTKGEATLQKSVEIPKQIPQAKTPYAGSATREQHAEVSYIFKV